MLGRGDPNVAAPPSMGDAPTPTPPANNDGDDSADTPAPPAPAAPAGKTAASTKKKLFGKSVKA